MSFRYERTVRIAAPRERIWGVLIDVERWREWTESIQSIERLDSGPFQTGSKVRIRQPGLPAMVWRVTSLAGNQEFTWETRSPGALTVAGHEIAPLDNGCTVLLRVVQSGIFATLLRPWIARVTRRNVELEAQALKRRCEAANPF